MTRPQTTVNPIFGKLPYYASFSFEPFLEFNKITTQLCSEIARENLQEINELVQCNTELAQNFSQIKRMDEIVNVQSHWAQKVMPILIEHGKQVAANMMSSVSDYQQLFTKERDQFENQKETVRR